MIRGPSARSPMRIGVAFLLAILPGPAAAQERTETSVRYASVDEILVQLRAGNRRVPIAATAAFRTDHHNRVLLRGNYQRYSDAERNELLDGVEQVARGDIAGSPEVVRRAIGSAFEIFAVIAFADIPTPERQRWQIPARLLRVYRETTHPTAKGSAVTWLGMHLRYAPPESDEVSELLAGLASAPPAAGPVPPQTAVRALKLACEAGVPVLRRLEREGVADFYVMHELRRLAELDFSVEVLNEAGHLRPCGV